MHYYSVLLLAIYLTTAKVLLLLRVLCYAPGLATHVKLLGS